MRSKYLLPRWQDRKQSGKLCSYSTIHLYVVILMVICFLLLSALQGVIECPNPDKDIRRFDANMRLFPPFIDNDLCPLTIKNTILQSCYLRNTEWACGVAVYTGKYLYFSNSVLVCLYYFILYIVLFFQSEIHS